MTISSRPSGLTRVECTGGESLGWKWSYPTFRDALKAAMRMTTLQKTAPDGWMSATAPDGKRHKAIPPDLED